MFVYISHRWSHTQKEEGCSGLMTNVKYGHFITNRSFTVFYVVPQYSLRYYLVVLFFLIDKDWDNMVVLTSYS